MYKIPDNYFLRLHFERSRFSRRLEDMLLLLAIKMVDIGTIAKEDFDKLLDDVIRQNNPVGTSDKTIRNQRTEMIRLFGLVKHIDGVVIPGKRLILLAENQDIPSFFKSFCKRFQYPGGFLKPDRVSELVINKVRFKPASYILRLLLAGESKHGNFAISSAEVTHFVFNDKRITVENENVGTVVDRILNSRSKDEKLDKTSDVIRYARDFLNYMVNANLLNELKGIYFLNHQEERAIRSIISDKEFFDGYSDVIKPDGSWNTNKYRKVDSEWSEWFADTKDEEELITPALALVKETNFPSEYKKIKALLERGVSKAGALKALGDEGQKIAYEHEINVIGKYKKEYTKFVKDVSSESGLGYDLLSVYPIEVVKEKYIEVKTTKKNFDTGIEIPFLITSNEWEVAKKLGDDYYIYRVIITKDGYTIFTIKNPYKVHGSGHIKLEPITFRVIYTQKAGSLI